MRPRRAILVCQDNLKHRPRKVTGHRVRSDGRKTGPGVVLHCPAFFHESGAWTGQVRDNPLESGAGRGTRRGSRRLSRDGEPLRTGPVIRYTSSFDVAAMPPEDAQDLTQAFFAWLLEKETWRALTRAGPFPSFLLARFRTSCSTSSTGCARSSEAAVRMTSIDMGDAEERFVSEPATADSADDHFIAGGRSCCSTVGCTRPAGYERAGKAALFARLVGLMTADSDDSCREAAADLAMTEGAVKVAVHRMRRRFRES